MHCCRLMPLLLAVALLAPGCRDRPVAPSPRRPVAPPASAVAVPGVVVELRSQLHLEPVLAAEAALREQPGDPAARSRLAEACFGAHDPVGAALALQPLVATTDHRPPTTDQQPTTDGGRPSSTQVLAFVRACLEVGWLGEAETALARLADPPREPRLELSGAYAWHGDASRAVALLQPLGKETLAPEEWRDGAIVWYHCRRREPAVAWARRAVDLAPGDTTALAVLARCLLAAGQPDTALSALRRRRELQEAELLSLWRGLAEARCRDARLRAAGRERLARLAARVRDDPAPAFHAGRELLLAGDARRAIPFLSRAAAGGHQEVLCYELLARAHTALGEVSDAEWARGRAHLARGQYAAAAAALGQSVAKDATRPLAHVDLATALHSAGRVDEAVSALDRAQKLASHSLEVRLLKAKLLLHQERAADVERELLAAAEIVPARANEPLGNLGTVYYDSQQFDRAIRVLERAVRIEGDDAHSHYYLGRTYARREEDPEQARKAVHHLLRAALMQPDFSRPWMTAADVLQGLGYPSEAAACLRRAIAGESQSDAPYVKLAQLLQVEGRSAERRWLLQRYAEIRDHDLTRTGLEKETRENPRDAERRFRLGELLLREGRPQKALPELLAAAGLRPGWRQAHARLADVCALLGYDEMREAAERGATAGGR
jgi:tetratricopeptide (TPR) repeat protein